MKRLCIAVVSVILPAFASAQSVTAAQNVPAALQPPAGQMLYLEASASGVQIYECAQQSDASYAWRFTAPEATLSTPSGQRIGKHYAGPTWESDDGSKVVGQVTAKDPGPSASAIPWLLLAAKSNEGRGVFANAKSIQRVATHGGIAPTTPCGAANLHASARVPYTATYNFYR